MCEGFGQFELTEKEMIAIIGLKANTLLKKRISLLTVKTYLRGLLIVEFRVEEDVVNRLIEEGLKEEENGA